MYKLVDEIESENGSDHCIFEFYRKGTSHIIKNTLKRTIWDLIST